KEIASKKEWWHLPPSARPWPACVPRSKRASGGRVPLRGRIARRSALETLFASLAHARDVLSLGMTTTPSGRTRALGNLSLRPTGPAFSERNRGDAALRSGFHAPSRCFAEPSRF